MQKTLIIITKPPHAHQSKQAYDTAVRLLAQGQSLSLFFYGDGAYVANRFNWQSQDVLDMTKAWYELASTHHLKLPVCVSTALARGITDTDNAKRHNLSGNNLHPAFSLVGLSELALLMTDDTDILTF